MLNPLTPGSRGGVLEWGKAQVWEPGAQPALGGECELVQVSRTGGHSSSCISNWDIVFSGAPCGCHLLTPCDALLILPIKICLATDNVAGFLKIKADKKTHSLLEIAATCFGVRLPQTCHKTQSLLSWGVITEVEKRKILSINIFFFRKLIVWYYCYYYLCMHWQYTLFYF